MMSTGRTTSWLRVLTIVSALAASPSSAISAEQDDITYRTLVQRVKGGDFTVDFYRLRIACLKSGHCEPRATSEEQEAMNRAGESHQLRRVVEIAERLIDKGFANGEAHAVCAQVYAELNESAKAKFHERVATALMESIIDRTDGKSIETAFEVICDREQAAVMMVLGLPYSGPAVSKTRVVAGGRHNYEKWETRNPKTAQNAVVFFNVDAFSPPAGRVGNK